MAEVDSRREKNEGGMAMPAPWKRIIPVGGVPGQIQAVQAKKHLTVFTRSPSAPGAGRLDVKTAFGECAGQTLGISNRIERMVKVQACMKGKRLKTGIYRKKSRARAGSPLFGRVYVTTPSGRSME